MNNLRKQKNNKTQKGITLIALIITIIVMLILVTVSVNIALGNGLFKATQSAAKNTEAEKIRETELSGGKVTVGTNTYSTIDEYVQEVTGQTGGAGVTYETYSVGDTVTLGTGANAETFYVIADSDENESTVKLITAKNVETTNFTQSDSANEVRFNDDMNNTYESSDISGLVASYKSALETRTGITIDNARLMLLAEAEALGAIFAETVQFTGDTEFMGTTNFWLGSPHQWTDEYCSAYYIILRLPDRKRGHGSERRASSSYRGLKI